VVILCEILHVSPLLVKNRHTLIIIEECAPVGSLQASCFRIAPERTP